MINKVYIASSIIYKTECQELSNKLEKNFGITITRKWWEYYVNDYPKHNVQTDSEFYSYPMVKMVRELDFKAIRDADIVIIINNKQHKHHPVGALIECGYAIAHNKIVIFYGGIRRSAMLSGCIHIKNVDELVKLIKRDYPLIEV